MSLPMPHHGQPGTLAAVSASISTPVRLEMRNRGPDPDPVVHPEVAGDPGPVRERLQVKCALCRSDVRNACEASLEPGEVQCCVGRKDPPSGLRHPARNERIDALDL